MKISKIDHTRATISVREKAVSGVIYDAPSKNQCAERNLREHIASCNEKAMFLYNVIDPKTDYLDKKDPKKCDYNNLIKYTNAAFKAALYMAKAEEKSSRIGYEVRFIRQIYSRKVKVGRDLVEGEKLNLSLALTDDDITTILLRGLRRTLRRNFNISENETVSSLDIVKEVMNAIFVIGNPDSLSEKKLSIFFDILDEDYRKQGRMAQIENSIKKQNVKASVKEVDGSYLLMPSGAEHKKKHYVFDFMKQYASADNLLKAELSVHIQKLILLYLYGEQGYETMEMEACFEDRSIFSFSIKERLESIANLTECNSADKRLLSEDKQKPEEKRVSSSQKAEIVKSIKSRSEEIRLHEESLRYDIERAMSDHFHEAANYLVANIKKSILGAISSTKASESADIYWLDYIDMTVEKLLIDNNKKHKTYRFERGYLCKHIYKEWTQYMASKFTDLGKAVYHFAIPDLSGVERGEIVSIRDVLPEFRNGISGFEYERIKANESLEREIAEYVAFAVNNFANAVSSPEERSKAKHEDVLSLRTAQETRKQDKQIVLRSDATRRILQFFGGQSAFTKEQELYPGIFTKEALYVSMRNEIASVRNTTFHYTAQFNETIKHDVAKIFFEKELREFGRSLRDKYYSNNVHRFFSIDDIDDLMRTIYADKKVRAAQVPAFNNIISRANIAKLLTGRFVDKDSFYAIQNVEDANAPEMYWSALFFVLKELYYYDFLQEQSGNENVKKRFLDALERRKDTAFKKKNQKENNALRDFEKKVNAIGRDKSFGEICQGLMVEYMLQNNEGQIVQTQSLQNMDNKKLLEQQSYKHYRTLLYELLRDAFMEYVKEKWNILSYPVWRNANLTKEAFGVDFSVSMYDHLEDTFNRTPEVASWYITAHFMNPKYLNYLIGGFRNYIQFTSDIERRAASLQNRLNIKAGDRIRRYEQILEMLEFVIHYCGKTTELVSDYFSEEEYARYLAHFVAFDNVSAYQDSLSALHAFCNQEINVNGEQTIAGIYSAGGRIIPNRHIFLSQMYGNEAILAGCIDRITMDEIRKMYETKGKLANVFKYGKCVNEYDQKTLKEFQNMRNRIELVDLRTYTEILNDMQGQLISWSYLRERDLMYYQLGYYYTKLFWTDIIGENDDRRSLNGTDVHVINGAMLYQILSLYSVNLPVIVNSETVKVHKNDGTIGSAIGTFMKEFKSGASYYLEGLQLFENTDEHAAIVLSRDYIDHFKYFALTDRSMMDLYSEVYDRFFRHDAKLKKSVSYTLTNIMARYFVNIPTSMVLTTKDIKKNDKQMVQHKATSIVVSEKGLSSTALSYKIYNTKEKKEQQVLVAARTNVFLKQLQSLIEYKKC